MKKIYIVGASGLAKEIATYILDCNEFSIVAFIDKSIENKSELVIRGIRYPILEEDFFLSELTCQQEKPNVVIAVGYPKIRKIIAEKYNPYCIFPNIIHPSVLIQDSLTKGYGNIISPFCSITIDIKIGNFNFFNTGVTVGHDAIIGNYNVFNPRTAVSGNVKIGDENLFGVGSSLLQNLTIGSRNTVGMNTALLKGIEDNNTWFGIPARKLL
jgi:sugar O-acyltransferase (sialic acid O-acetyltransferase NeuD family)